MPSGGYRKLLQRAEGLSWKPDGEGEQLDAAVFRFQLNAGCYATTFLRELLGADDVLFC